MVDLRIVDAPEIPTNSITGQEKLPTGGSGNYSITLDSLADYTKTKKDLTDNTAVDNKVNSVRQELDAHIEDLSNPHQVTKGQIGLGNVDNTADADKPVSNSTQAAIISAVAPKANKADVYTKQESSDLVNNSISTALTPVNTSLDLAKRGIANRYDAALTYNLGERVVLTNGDIVKSTVDGNANNPNVNMTGWAYPISTNALSHDIKPISDVTAQLAALLNNPHITDIYINVAGDYLISDTITIKSPTKKRIFFAKDAVLKTNFSTSKRLFNVESEIELHSPNFDFSNNHIQCALDYKPVAKRCFIRNATFKNLRDLDAASNSYLIQLDRGISIDIDGVHFENIFKRGSGTGNESGLVAGMVVHNITNSEPLQTGVIRNITTDEMGNINSAGEIYAGGGAKTIQVFSLGNEFDNLLIENVALKNFGRRGIKIQAGGVKLRNISGHSDRVIVDTLTLLGMQSDGGFINRNNHAEGITFSGYAMYGVAVSSSDSSVRDIDLKFTPTTSSATAVYIGSNCDNVTIDGMVGDNIRQEVVLDSASGSISNIKVNNRTIKPAYAGNLLSQLGTNPVSNISLSQLTMEDSYGVVASLANLVAETKIINGLTIDWVTYKLNTSALSKIATLHNINNLRINNIVEMTALNHSSVTTGDGIDLRDSSNVLIDNIELKTILNRPFLIQNTQSNLTLGSGIKLPRAYGVAHFIFGAGVKTDVSIAQELTKYRFSLNATLDLSELTLRSGITANRPKHASLGYVYFDETLSKPITCKKTAVYNSSGVFESAAVWVDATGATI